EINQSDELLIRKRLEVLYKVILTQHIPRNELICLIRTILWVKARHSAMANICHACLVSCQKILRPMLMPAIIVEGRKRKRSVDNTEEYKAIARDEENKVNGLDNSKSVVSGNEHKASIAPQSNEQGISMTNI